VPASIWIIAHLRCEIILLLDPKRLVLIDGEAWRAAGPSAAPNGLKTNMAPLRGWAPVGARLPGKAPFGHWHTSTFLAALRHDAITAPCVFDGPINGEPSITRARCWNPVSQGSAEIFA
tara:strand:+ start:37696 stop:38052 length:357 start_codon:yes stop_codon:yes gene_type:complete